MSVIDPLGSEQQVESMIKDGRRVMDSAVAKYRPVAIIAAFSGGDDSVVSSHFAAAEYDAAVFHCETSIGLEATRRHVFAVGARFGWDLRAERATPEGMPEKGSDGRPFDPTKLPAGRWTDAGTPYEEFVLNYGFPAPPQHQRMYDRLKLRPLRCLVRDAKRGRSRNSTVLIVSGIRVDESTIRAGYKRDTMKEKASSRVWVNPFYWRTALDFEAYRQEFGLPRNPVKARIGISGECLCGSFAKPGEREAIRSTDPGMGTYLDGLEARARSNGFPWGWGERAPSWWADARRGQGFLFDYDDTQQFRPMCVGCSRRAVS